MNSTGKHAPALFILLLFLTCTEHIHYRPVPSNYVYTIIQRNDSLYFSTMNGETSPFSNKIVGLYTLVGLFIMVLLVMAVSAKQAMAIEPTPTPVVTPLTSLSDESKDNVCRLAVGQECDFTKPLDEVSYWN